MKHATPKVVTQRYVAHKSFMAVEILSIQYRKLKRKTSYEENRLLTKQRQTSTPNIGTENICMNPFTVRPDSRYWNKSLGNRVAHLFVYCCAVLMEVTPGPSLARMATTSLAVLNIAFNCKLRLGRVQPIRGEDCNPLCLPCKTRYWPNYVLA